MPNDQRISIAFATIQCYRCGIDRVRMRPCGDCGAPPAPHETQPDLERRRRIVEAFRAAPRTNSRAATDFEATLNFAAAAGKSLGREIAKVARSGTSATPLIDAFSRLDEHVNTWTTRQPRPHANIGRALGDALADLRDGYALLVEALAEPDVPDAKARQAEGQALLDRAGVYASRLSMLAEQLNRDDESVGDYLESVAEKAIRSTQNPATVDLLDERLREIHGHGDSDTVGLGIHAEVFGAMFSTVFDIEEAMNVVESARGLLIGNTGSREVFQSDAWQREHARVTALVSAAAFGLTRLSEATDLEAVKAFLEIVLVCREGAIPHGLATLTAKSAGEYSTQRSKQSGSIIKRASEQHPNLHLNENLHGELRHAAGHVDFDVDERGVVIRGNGHTSVITEDEFIDGCLGYMETAAALLLAMETQAMRSGVRLDLDRHRSDRDRANAIVLMGRLLGFSDIDVSIESDEVKILAHGDPAKFSTLAASTSAPTTAQARITARIGTAEAWVECHTSLSTHREFQYDPNADQQGLIASMAPQIAATTIDGLSPWTEVEWRTAAFVVGQPRDKEPPLETARRIGAFRRIAKSAGAESAVEMCGLRLEQLRSSTAASSVPAAFNRSR